MFTKNPEEVAAILKVMREAGVESFELDSLKVIFGDEKHIPLDTVESSEARLERMKRDLMAERAEQAENEAWST